MRTTILALALLLTTASATLDTDRRDGQRGVVSEIDGAIACEAIPRERDTLVWCYVPGAGEPGRR